MKIAVLFPRSRIAAWSLCDGVVNTLRRMGHEVVGCEIPQITGNISEPQFEAIKASLPSLDTLKQQNLLIVSGPEHVGPWIDAIYGKYEWKQLPARKAGWFHESFFREDLSIDFDTVRYWADEYFFPAIQDAEFFDQECFAKGRAHYLPMGVDTEVFAQCSFCRGSGRRQHEGSLSGCLAADWPKCEVCKGTKMASSPNGKRWPIVAFIGSIYGKREQFLNALQRHDHPRIRLGSVTIEDLSGYCAEESARRLASNYRQIAVFLNLPSLSQLLVSKIFEVMACGTFLMTPLLTGDRGISGNQKLFETGRHLVYYRSSNTPYVAQLLREWSSEEKAAEREKIAAEGCREVHEKHSLERRLEVILEKCGVREVVQ